MKEIYKYMITEDQLDALYDKKSSILKDGEYLRPYVFPRWETHYQIRRIENVIVFVPDGFTRVERQYFLIENEEDEKLLKSWIGKEEPVQEKKEMTEIEIFQDNIRREKELDRYLED